MRSRSWRIAAASTLAAAGAVLAWMQVTSAPPAPLAPVIPSGALLYVEARDFSALLKDWNATPEKAAWLGSDNYSVFSRTKLFKRLESMQAEFALAAGFPVSMASLDAVAGSQSALALYDIGSLQFVYVTRLARGAPALLDKARPAYQTRKVGAVNYYVNTDAASGRVAAFAYDRGLLILATREDLVADTLKLAAGQSGVSPVTRDGWFDRGVKAAGPAGELRIVANMEALVAAPHFRSYWVHQNITELKQFSSFVSDLFRGPGEIREERVLVRAQAPDAPPAASAAVSDLVALAPASEGFYKAWAAPEADQAAALVVAKILAPRDGLQPQLSNVASPSAQASSPVAGEPAPEAAAEDSEDAADRPPDSQANPSTAASPAAFYNPDLETRIDTPPAASIASRLEVQPLEQALASNTIEGAIQIESARTLDDKVFVGTRCAVAFLGKSDWKGDTVRAGLSAAVAGLYSTSSLGLQWVARSASGTAVHDLDGLLPLSVAVRGKLLVVSSDAALLNAILALPAPSGRAAASSPVFAAGYRHARQLPLFQRMTRMIEAAENRGSNSAGSASDSERVPQFFSENLGSLGHALRRVQSATIEVRDTGATVPQTVVYKLAR